jgi:hypothetical protein
MTQENGAEELTRLLKATRLALRGYLKPGPGFNKDIYVALLALLNEPRARACPGLMRDRILRGLGMRN